MIISMIKNIVAILIMTLGKSVYSMNRQMLPDQSAMNSRTSINNSIEHYRDPIKLRTYDETIYMLDTYLFNQVADSSNHMILNESRIIGQAILIRHAIQLIEDDAFDILQNFAYQERNLLHKELVYIRKKNRLRNAILAMYVICHMIHVYMKRNVQNNSTI